MTLIKSCNEEGRRNRHLTNSDLILVQKQQISHEKIGYLATILEIWRRLASFERIVAKVTNRWR